MATDTKQESSNLNTFIHYLISFGVLKGSSFLLIPIYANFLDKSEYGFFIFLITILSFLSLITDMGLNNGLYRFINKKNNHTVIFSNTIILSFLVNLIVFISVYFLFDFVDFPYEVQEYHLVLLCFSLMLASFTMLNLTLFRIKNRSLHYLICSVCQPFFHIVFFLILISKDSVSIDYLLLSTLMSNIIAVFISISLNSNFSIITLDYKTMKKIIKYTYGTMVSVLALYALTGFDKFILSYNLTPELFADYSLIVLFASITILSTEPISLWYFANRFRLIEDNIKLFSKITSNLVIFNLWIAIFLLINISTLFNVLLPSNYDFNFSFFFIAVLGFHLKYLSTILNVGCYIDDNTNIVAKINVFASVLTICCYFLVIENTGVLGILSSIVLGYFVILALNLHNSNKRVKIYYNYKLISLNYLSAFIVLMLIYINAPLYLINLIAFSSLLFINKEGTNYVIKYIRDKTKNQIFRKHIL